MIQADHPAPSHYDGSMTVHPLLRSAMGCAVAAVEALMNNVGEWVGV